MALKCFEDLRLIFKNVTVFVSDNVCNILKAHKHFIKSLLPEPEYLTCNTHIALAGRKFQNIETQQGKNIVRAGKRTAQRILGVWLQVLAIYFPLNQVKKDGAAGVLQQSTMQSIFLYRICGEGREYHTKQWCADRAQGVVELWDTALINHWKWHVMSTWPDGLKVVTEFTKPGKRTLQMSITLIP